MLGRLACDVGIAAAPLPPLRAYVSGRGAVYRGHWTQASCLPVAIAAVRRRTAGRPTERGRTDGRLQQSIYLYPCVQTALT